MTVHTDILIQYHLPFCLLSVLSHSLGFLLYLVKLEGNFVMEKYHGLGKKMDRLCAFKETFCVFHVVTFFESLWIFCAFHGTFCIFRKTFCEFQERFCVFQKTNCVFQETFFALLKKRFCVFSKTFCAFLEKDFVHYRKDFVYFSKHFVYFGKHVSHLSATVIMPY